ncbi:FHA domain-containing protein [Paramicrobacterium humi]|uniref:FHA domain-containing protein n=1 Tax=Paramicrobacterium humi TaxID=640635 RepID=A0A1H4J2V5_9MICO|nr:FHA domain-containing protein [Microbacterium humi]SEB40650.1 FHA domain-containing protein [Microbacterium humi]
MTQYSYTPASGRDWLAVAAEGRLLIVRVSADDELLARVAALRLEELSVHETLDALTERGLARTADFALCFWVSGSLQTEGAGVIVYGDTAVDVATADGSRRVRPTGVSGWGEELVEGATSIRFAPHGDEESALPLQAGAVWASSITVVADSLEPAAAPQPSPAGAVAEPESDAEPVAEPEPQPEPAEEPSFSRPATAPTTMYGESPSAPPAPPLPVPNLEATIVPEATLHPQQLPVTPAPVAASDVDESTVVRAPGSAEAPAGPHTPLGDHDGMTVLAKDVKAARDAAHVAEHSAAASDLPSYAFALELPGGRTQPLDAPVVLGRAPSVSNVPASVLPHLVTLAGDDISRNHVRVAVEGDTVVVTDLHSSNGTHVVVPGRPPQQLRGGEQVPVISGTIVDLGSGVTLRVLEA